MYIVIIGRIYKHLLTSRFVKTDKKEENFTLSPYSLLRLNMNLWLDANLYPDSPLHVTVVIRGRLGSQSGSIYTSHSLTCA